jgi:hypothetical protein
MEVLLKLKSLFVVLALTVASSAFAQQWRQVNAFANVSQNQVSVQVSNSLIPMMQCRGYVYGQTQTGFVRNAWFADVVPYMQYRYAYVGTFAGEYFVRGWANIECLF